MIQEIAIAIKVQILELALPDELIRHLALQIHEELQHLIIRFSRKQNFTRVKLVYRTTDGPHVDAVIIRYTKN